MEHFKDLKMSSGVPTLMSKAQGTYFNASQMKKIAFLLIFIVAAVKALQAAPLVAPDIDLLKEQNQIKLESEKKIQDEILDPILGPGEAVAFVDVEMSVKVESERLKRKGVGEAQKYHQKNNNDNSANMNTNFVMPGIPKPTAITAGGPKTPPNSASAQAAQESKGIQQETYAVNPIFKKLTVTVIHDQNVLKDKNQIEMVRSRIVDAMGQYHLAPENIFFRATPFAHIKNDWKEDLKKPSVYLPLLYAFLLLLLLSFLFGPLRKFLKAYIQALMEKPQSEVEVTGEEGGGDDENDGEDDNALSQEGKLDINFTRKPDEPPPPPVDEEDEMKKFEPFAYINDENVKRLAYMFILRKEEPWVVAVVASYLKPDLARQLLTSLPVDLQAKVALEALTVRQVTRDQVIAIDGDVKENVDFVVGGIERLVVLLDESDSATRANILNYLKNEKPLVYEAVRKHILIFEDIASFPDRDMQTIVRELKTDLMARALTGAPPEVLNKFLSSMSAGAASLLKETMEYTQGLNPNQIEDERTKVMDLIKALEKDGKISVRKQGQQGYDMVEGMQEELSAMERRQKRFQSARQKNQPETPSISADPAKAQAYFDAAVSQYQAGQADAAVSYFEAALTLNPSLWQAHQYLGTLLYQKGDVQGALAHYEKVLEINPDPQLKVWVDGFKSQVGGNLNG